MVISKKVAEKIFGSVDGALGKTVLFNGQEGYMVKGIMEDQPLQAHFRMEVLISFITAEQRFEWLQSWGNNSMATYVKVREGTDIEQLSAKFPEFVLKYF